MNRRALLRATAGAFGVALAGCAATGGDRPTPTTVAPVASDLVRSGIGPFPHGISVSNPGDDSVSVTVRVSRDDDLLYRKTHRVPPGDTERTVAGITEGSFPEGNRTVRIEFASGDRTRGVTVEVHDCLGDVICSVGSDGLDVIYSIC
ncbi:hypothetical protein ACFO3H_14230 [Halorussus sp. GCM10023401]|uniref:hypothetical protein n=1 Tax=Halorussus vallis TaxID=2953749 RepID=UPI0020A0D3D8|nr:hypothetical protein [Halorussus vallis]USZ76559.1 hypothetical protein NGM07_04340 [Halorussus vallis]